MRSASVRPCSSAHFHPNVASAIVGVSRPEQLDDNAAAVGVELDASTLASIDEALGAVVVR